MSSERLLVYMRIGERAGDVEEAIAAVLRQEAVAFRFAVVDDRALNGAGLPDVTDARIRFVRNERRLGVSECRRIALAASDAPFVAEVPPRGVVLPDALRKLVDACDASPRSGIAHCWSFEADAEGKVERETHRARRAYFQTHLTRSDDVRREILLGGDVFGPLRVFRREALAGSNGVTTGHERASELAAMARIADRFEIVTVPQYLFYDRALPAPRRSVLRCALDAARQSLAVGKEIGPNGFFARGGHRVGRLLLTRFCRESGLQRIVVLARTVRMLPRRLWRRVLVPRGERIYWALAARAEGMALWLLPAATRSRRREQQRIAYYIWHFPVLSQTFVNRELAALKRSGLHVEVIAEGAEDVALSDHNAADLLGSTKYLEAPHTAAVARHRRYFRWRRPIAYLRVLLFTVACRYARQKRLSMDLAEFSKAVHLAGVLREMGATRVHAPWADRCALVALMASRLAGIPYSVQARAHDIHRDSYRYGLREKLEPAEFIVTNTAYNAIHLATLAGETSRRRIHVIHNGVDLDRFEPAPHTAGRPARLLCVARLIEQKGLTHLLEACRMLLDRGVELECEIVGGPENPLYTAYLLELNKLHRRLRLKENVHFAGPLPLREVLEKYRGADVFVLPCVVAADGSRDIIPNSLIEAMAMALPVVSTTIGGVPEIVEDGVSGLLVKPGNPVALADAVESLIRDRSRARELGAAARRRVEEKFDIARNIEGYVKLFSGRPRDEERAMSRHRQAFTSERTG